MSAQGDGTTAPALRKCRALGWGAALAVSLMLVGCSGAEQADTEQTGSAGASTVAPASAVQLAGEWTLNIDTPMGLQHPVLSIATTAAGYSATYSGRQGVLAIDQVTLDGNRFSFPLSITVPIGTIEVIYEGEINGNQMTGVVQNPRGQVPFSGERTGG